ncbi:FAD-binding oxidoreductase [uncultured Aquitalea sp.]|uniref:NAD(P)/FAD-dependent oxidoreductase n=1 Tax=uncultured Aquitalea sp. TaxID=540272 RepID=UPI0025EDBAA8|nr:FAD-binding oxidoreductase [uncultured Aquitalea sp.]
MTQNAYADILRQPFSWIDNSASLPAMADAIIIGAGVAGVSAALHLTKRGLRVVLLEKGLVAAEQSSRNWGWVRQQGRDRRELPLIVRSLAIWEQWQAELDTDLGFRRTGLISLTREPAELARWQRWAKRGRAAGIDVLELNGAQAEAALPSSGAPWIGGLQTPTDARAEPGIAVPALAQAACRAGTSLHQQTAVRRLLVEDGRVVGVETEKGQVRSSRVLLAGGAWSSLFLRQHGISLPQLNVRATVARTTPAPAIIPGTFCASDFCLRYREDGGFTLTLLEGEQHDIGPDSFRFFRQFFPLLAKNWRHMHLNALPASYVQQRRWQAMPPTQGETVFERERIYNPQPDMRQIDEAMRRFKLGRPELADVQLAAAWAGRIDLTPDLVPVISAVSALPGLVVATGFSGHGFGIGPGAGELAADLLMQTGPTVDPHEFRLSRFSDGSPMFIDPDVI